ncbi:MAG: hypothetical protein ABI642_13935 [Polaromonas sp.]
MTAMVLREIRIFATESIAAFADPACVNGFFHTKIRYLHGAAAAPAYFFTQSA